LTTVVLHVFPHAPQLLKSPIVSAHVVGFAVGHAVSPGLQLSVQMPAAHAGCPAPLVGPAQVLPHPPQLAGSCCSSTHAVGAAVGQPVKPVLHVKLHLLATHVGCEFPTMLEQTLLHPLQSLGLLVVSTHAPLHEVGVAAAQPVEHA
jgi:hypothetical protein